MRTPVPFTCYSSISHTLWHADPRPAYLPFVHFPSRSACWPLLTTTWPRPYPTNLLFVHLPTKVTKLPLDHCWPLPRPRDPPPPHPTNLLFVRLPTKVSEWPLDHCWPLHGHAPHPTNLLFVRLPTKVTEWSLDHWWPLPRPRDPPPHPTNLLFVRLPTKVSEWPLDHCWSLHGHAPVPQTYYLSAYLLKWQNDPLTTADHCPALGIRPPRPTNLQFVRLPTTKLQVGYVSICNLLNGIAIIG